MRRSSPQSSSSCGSELERWCSGRWRAAASRGYAGRVKLPGILVAAAVASLMPVSNEHIDIGPPPAPPRVGPSASVPQPRKKRSKAQVMQRIGRKAARRRF
jgi:hypothetical protein